MWVDILPYDKAQYILPRVPAAPIPEDYELRIIVWGVSNINFRTEQYEHHLTAGKPVLKLKNFFVTGTLPDAIVPPGLGFYYKKSLQTVTYSNVQVNPHTKRGEAEFNWRMCWKIKLPCKTPFVQFRLWDREIPDENDPNANPNAFWAQAWVNLGDLFRTARAKEASVSLEPSVVSSDPHKHVSGAGFRSSAQDAHNVRDPEAIIMVHPNFPEPQALLHISIEALPEAEAFVRKAGQGWSPPNNPSVGYVKRPSDFYWRAFLSFVNYYWTVHRFGDFFFF